MDTLKPLIMMQLKDKIDLSFLADKKKTLFGIIYKVILFVAITALSYLLFMLTQMIHLFSVVNNTPISVIVVLITVTQLLSIFSCSLGLMKSFYFSPDNFVLLTMPVSTMKVFLSKFIVYYLNELYKNIYFILPILLSFGLLNGYSFAFYPWLVVGIVILSLIPVVIGAFLSIPAMVITMFLRQYRLLQYILISIGVLGFVFLVFKGISIIPENINIIGQWGYVSNLIQDFLKRFSEIFLPFAWLTQFIVGYRKGFTIHLFSWNTLWIFFGIVAVVAVCLTLSLLLVKPLFLKMSSRPFEYKKVLITKQKTNHGKNSFVSALVVELKKNTRTSNVFVNTVTVFFVLPMAIFFFDKILSSMNTRLLGQYMSYSFNILIMLLILLSNNSQIASTYSSEGLAGLLNKTRPVNSCSILLPKLVWQTVFSTISTIITIIFFQLVLKIEVINVIFFCLMIILFNAGHILWSAEMDFMNPKFQQYQTFGNTAQNANETKSTIMAFVIAFLMFGISLFLFNDGYKFAWLKLFLIALAFFGFRLFSFIQKQRVYYREKV